MPIGKNALKRVSNNGYSNVKTEAPDMENSEVEVLAEEKAQTNVTKPSPKKPTEKKAASTSKTKKVSDALRSEKKAPSTAKTKKTSETDKKVTSKTKTADNKDSHPDGFVRIAFGDDLPVHLL